MNERDAREVAAVLAERDRQRALGHFDEDDYPDATGSPSSIDALAWVRRDFEFAEQIGRITWAHVLREEVAEALAEEDFERLRAELHQVAAVAIRWAGALTKRMQDDDDDSTDR